MSDQQDLDTTAPNTPIAPTGVSAGALSLDDLGNVVGGAAQSTAGPHVKTTAPRPLGLIGEVLEGTGI